MHSYEIVWEDRSLDGAAWVRAEFEHLWRIGRPLSQAVIEEVGRCAKKVEISLAELGDDPVEIGKGNPVRVGEYVDVFKLTQGERHGASVLNVGDIGGPVQVEVHDLETGDSTILEMDSRPRKKLSELDDTLLNPKSK